jgi:4-amino-4-deoxy-L-arabinose transferase-like glycosyltransferase
MSRLIRTWLIPVLFVLWLFFVVGSFFTVQKPFSAENARAVAAVLLDLLATAWLGLSALGLGAGLLERLLPGRLVLAEKLVFGTGLGLGLLGLAIFGLGLAGLFQPAVAYAATAALTAMVARPLWRLGHQVRHWRPSHWPSRWLTLYLLALALLTLLVALLPPTDWDGLFYHLTGPKIYVRADGIVGGIDIPHLSFPSLMEMLFAWLILLRGDIAAKLIHASFALLLTGLVYLTARRFLHRQAAWPAVIILTSMPMLGALAGWAYNDLALAFYQLASLYAFLRNEQLTISNEQLVIQNSKFKIQSSSHLPTLPPSNPPTLHPSNPPPFHPSTLHPSNLPICQSSNLSPFLLLSALFAGLAMGLKYTSFITPVTVGLLILGSAARWGRYKDALLNFAVFSSVALLVAAPWYLKNYGFTGNPVYPFLYGLFGGQFWDEFRAERYAAAGSGIGFNPTTLLALPWLLTLGIRDVNYWDGRTGPLLLLFLPLVIGFSLARRPKHRPQALNPLLVYTLAQFGFWTLGVIWSQSLWQSRLLLPGLAGLAPLAGWTWTNLSRFDRPQFSVARLATITVGLTLILTLIDAGLLALKINPLPYLTGFESRDAYLTRRLGAHYVAMQEINTRLPPEAKVVFLWEPRSYYCDRVCQPDSILDKFPHLVHRYGSAGEIVRGWREARITHVLVHTMGLSYLPNRSPDLVRETLAMVEQNYLEPVVDVGEAYRLYLLPSGDPAYESRLK